MGDILFTLKSGNRKTGPIPVAYAQRSTCPPACPLKSNGCYGEQHPVNIHWNRLDKGAAGITFTEFLSEVRNLPDGTFWRYGIVGDAPGPGNRIDQNSWIDLIEAASHTRGFMFTHKPPVGKNYDLIQWANRRRGITVNLSANTLENADFLHMLGIGPVAVVLPAETSKSALRTPNGIKVTVCPATRHENVTCDKCRRCADVHRTDIIGFPAHGAPHNKKRADRVARGESYGV